MRDQRKNGIIINFTPTGIIPTKEMTPHVPTTPREIIDDVVRCAELGANVVHLHACDEKGNRTYSKKVYEQIILGIREKCSDIVIGVSCSGRMISEFEKRTDSLDLNYGSKPDMASLTLSSLNFNNEVSVNSPEMIKRMAAKMLDRGIKPEMEVFDLGMINYAHYLIRKKLLEPPYYFNLILGNIACAQARALHFGLIMNELPDDSIVTIGGVGDFQHDMNVSGIIFADGVRVGLEDNIYFDAERTKLATNVELVERIVDHSEILGRKIATPEDVRNRLDIPLI